MNAFDDDMDYRLNNPEDDFYMGPRHGGRGGGRGGGPDGGPDGDGCLSSCVETVIVVGLMWLVVKVVFG